MYFRLKYVSLGEAYVLAKVSHLHNLNLCFNHALGHALEHALDHALFKRHA